MQFQIFILLGINLNLSRTYKEEEEVRTLKHNPLEWKTAIDYSGLTS